MAIGERSAIVNGGAQDIRLIAVILEGVDLHRIVFAFASSAVGVASNSSNQTRFQFGFCQSAVVGGADDGAMLIVSSRSELLAGPIATLELSRQWTQYLNSPASVGVPWINPVFDIVSPGGSLP